MLALVPEGLEVWEQEEVERLIGKNRTEESRERLWIKQDGTQSSCWP